jgi:hypothetical protein
MQNILMDLKHDKDKRVKLFIYAAILLLAVFLRFIRYDQRWGLAYDQARDAIVAREILAGKGLPLVGPFSSAGNFTTGPIWYWFVALATMAFPFTIITPWVVLTLTYLLMVLLSIRIGYIIGGLSMAVILGILTAVSPAEINQGFNLTNPSLVAVFVTIALWTGFEYLNSGTFIMAALFGLACGSAVTSHYQAALILIFAVTVFLTRKIKFAHIVAWILSFTLPFVPLIFFDLTHNYYNLRGIIDYARFGQYAVYIPNRWMTYAGKFIPYLWGTIIGGNTPMGYFIIILTGITFLLTLVNHKLQKIFWGTLLSTALMIFCLRYYRGEKYESYFVFLHPFILTISAWTLFMIYRKQQILGIILIGIITIYSIIPILKSALKAENYTDLEAKGWVRVLTQKYPQEKFDMYDFRYNSAGKSLALTLYLNQKNLISSTGHRIGFGTPPKTERTYHMEILENNVGYDLWDLTASSPAVLQKNEWARINPENIFKGITRWYEN